MFGINKKQIEELQDELKFYKDKYKEYQEFKFKFQYQMNLEKEKHRIDLLCEDLENKFNKYLKHIEEVVGIIPTNVNLKIEFFNEYQPIKANAIEFGEINIPAFRVRFVKGESNGREIFG